MKVHYPKLYNMTHFFSLNVFTASKGSNNYILFSIIMRLKIGILYPWMSNKNVVSMDSKVPQYHTLDLS